MDVDEVSFAKSSSSSSSILSSTSYKYRTYLLHKPLGAVSSTVDDIVNTVITKKTSDRCGEKYDGEIRPTIYDIVKQNKTDVFPTDCMAVGRLDIDTSGLLLFTDDRQLASAIRDPVDSSSDLYHSSYKQKVYELYISSRYKFNSLDDFNIPDMIKNFSEPYSFSREGKEYTTNDQCRVEIIKIERKEELSYGRPDLGWTVLMHVTINEGKHHQVRRMAYRNRFHIISLKRIRLASILTLDSVPEPGDCRWLTSAEIDTLYRELRLTHTSDT